MKILHSVCELKNEIKRQRSLASGASDVGFVPTMGALHEGHASLLRRSKAENQITVCSIFVNPTQFNDPKDLERYPRTLELDSVICEREGVDVLFAPSASELYPHGYRYQIKENEFSAQLCGRYRPGHFEGMLTIVMKLLNAVNPQRAYFGEKDFQQLTLVQDMARDFFLDVEIVACPTFREVSGLAMSSRNQLLNSEQRLKASAICHALSTISDRGECAQFLKEQGFALEYLEDFRGRRCVALRYHDVRLIDNVPLAEIAKQQLSNNEVSL